MNADPRLIQLAAQLGRLVRAYGRADLENGHAALEVANAFNAALGEPVADFVNVALPLEDRGYMGDSVFHVDAHGGVQLEFYANGINAVGIDNFARHEDQPQDLLQPFARLELDLDGKFQVAVHAKSGRLVHCHTIADNFPRDPEE